MVIVEAKLCLTIVKLIRIAVMMIFKCLISARMVILQCKLSNYNVIPALSDHPVSFIIILSSFFSKVVQSFIYKDSCGCDLLKIEQDESDVMVNDMFNHGFVFF